MWEELKTWGCRWTEPSVSNVWDSFLCCLLKLIKKCSYHDLAATKREEKTHKRTNGRGEGGERVPAQLL